MKMDCGVDVMRSVGFCVFVLCACAGLAGAWSLESANGVSDETGLPCELRDEDLLWSIKSGTHQYSVPIFEDGRIYLGLNDQTLKHAVLKKSGGGVAMCVDAATREMVWQVVIPRYMEGAKAPFHFNHWRCGVCSTPAMDEERMYIVGPRGDVLCLDRAGLADGNDGPFTDEGDYMGYAEGSKAKLAATDGDIVWQFDMIKELKVVPHDVCGSSPVLAGDYLYVCTSNGQDDQHKYVVNPQAPSLIVLNKRTGRLAAVDGELIGKRIFHGLWSSPVVAKIKGRVMILYGGGDGVLYAFEPAAGDEAGTLKKIWQRDCNPEGYRAVAYTNWRQKSPKGPSEIIGTPVVYEGRIYVAIGQSPIHGKGQGALSCIDGATGKIVWQSQLVDRSLCTVSAVEGLVYIADYSGNLHCFDAGTGKRWWVHDLGAGVWSASTFVADGKVYIGTEGNVFWVLKAGREKEVLSRQRVDSMPITVTADKGVLYVPTQRGLYAYKAK